MTRQDLIDYISGNIYPNGQNQITAPMVRDSVLAVVAFMGDAATYGIGTVTDGSTGLVTGGDVYSAINAAITSAIKFAGVSSTVITDGGTETPTIHGVPYYPNTGDVVLYGGKEFLWTGIDWEQLGDESSFALKTITITGTGYLTGGGDLTENRTLDISETVKEYIDHGQTAYGWGDHSQAGYLKSSVAAATYETITNVNLVRNRVANLEKMFLEVEYTVGQETRKYLKLNPTYFDGFVSDGFGIFSGDANFTPGGGGGGADLGQVWQSLQNAAAPVQFATNLKFHQDHLPATGTGLAYTTNADGLAMGIGIASGYKLPTTTEWDNKADASALAGYVTLATAQTISGSKIFSAGELSIKNPSGGVVKLTFDRGANTSWEASVRSGDFYLEEKASPKTFLRINEVIKGGLVDIYSNVRASSFIVNGGTESQFLKANGTVDSNAYYYSGNFVAGTNYVAPSTLDSYLLRSGGSMTGGINFYAGDNDTWLFNVSGSRELLRSYGYGLLYEGTGIGNTNYLKLIANNQGGTEVTAITIDQSGRISCGSSSTSPYYQFNVNGALNATTIYQNGVALGASYLSLSGGTMSNTNLVTNLNADLLDGRDADGFLRRQELERSGQSYDANNLTQSDTHYTTNGDRTNVQGWTNFPDSNLSGPFGLIHLKDGSYPVQLFHNYSSQNFWVRYKLFADGNVWYNWEKFWTSGNSNLTTVPWSASSLTLAGAISGVTNINSSIAFGSNTSNLPVLNIAKITATTDYLHLWVTATHRPLVLQYGAGNVGVGVPQPSYKLDVSGVIHSTTGVLSDGYGIFATSATSSDERLKGNICSIGPERAWEVLKRLKPKEWIWNYKYVTPGKRGAGLIAQDVEDVLDFSVVSKGKYLHLDYNVMHGFEIAGLQDVDNRLSEQEKRLRDAEKKIAILEAENEKLKMRLNN